MKGIEKVEVMRDEDNRFSFFLKGGDLGNEYIYSSNIESRVDLIEYDRIWIKKPDLKEFDTSFFASRESDIEISIEKSCLDTKFVKEFRQDASKEKGREWFRQGVFELLVGIVDGFEVFDEGNSRYFRNILKGEKYPFFTSFVWIHLGNIDSTQEKLTCGMVAWMSEK